MRLKNKITVPTDFSPLPHFPRNLHTKSLPPLSLPFSPISILIPLHLLHSPHFLYTFPLFSHIWNELFEALSVLLFAAMDDFSQLGFSQMAWV
uniref:Uncharacterized protein n=1 Tax=Cucumis melo TaxID=3656 RepID=A0A9I9CYW1_CUCME